MGLIHFQTVTDGNKILNIHENYGDGIDVLVHNHIQLTELRGRAPVLWTLSKRSGSLFQAPLFAALNLEGHALAVAAAQNPVAKIAANAGNLLACPTTAATPSEIFTFMRQCHSDRKSLERGLQAHGSIVHVTMGSPWDAFYLKAARDAGLKVVYTIHDATRHPGEENYLIERVEQLALRNADHVVTVSRHVFESLKAQQRLHVPVHLVEGGLLTQSEPQIMPRSFPAHRPVKLLFLGRIHPYKGLDILLEALLILQKTGKKGFSLTIAGSGDIAPYQGLIDRLSNVSLINKWISDDEVREILVVHDVMVLPYIEASQSGVALDAQWAAMPSVATRVGALPKQLTDGKDSLFSAAPTATKLAITIDHIIRDKNLYEALSIGAHASYQRVGIKPVAQKWRDFYANIIG